MALMRCPSVTTDDAGCQHIIAQHLEGFGFKVTHLPKSGVSNLWARHGTEEPLMVFAGHTDVVPIGNEAQWQFPPFEPVIKGGYLHGRGAQDMKGGLAAMIIAATEFVKANPQYKGSIGFIITSGEESGDDKHGTAAVMDYLQQQQQKITWAVVGEPSSASIVGDTIRNGRRGSLKGYLTVQGVQGHVAYPELAKNPIHVALPALKELVQTSWDKGNEYFPPTGFQIANIHAGTGALNVIPGEMQVSFSFRYSTALSAEDIEQRVNAILKAHHIDYSLHWALSGKPFLTPPGELIHVVSDAIAKVNGVRVKLSTAGGTSDARFIAPTGAQVIELGTTNDTIHQVNERVKVAELEQLKDIYSLILSKLLPIKG